MEDGNVVTAGGVASSIKFALHIATQIVGEETAQAIQLGIEYDPAPPFTSGHPDWAPASVTTLVAPSTQKDARLIGRFRSHEI